jgi:hypothetical protein
MDTYLFEQGNAGEEELLLRMLDYFGDEFVIQRTCDMPSYGDMFCCDFALSAGEDKPILCFIELKSRTIIKPEWTSLMIGRHKIKTCSDRIRLMPDEKFIFIWKDNSVDDGYYYMKGFSHMEHNFHPRGTKTFVPKDYTEYGTIKEVCDFIREIIVDLDNDIKT